MAKRKEEPIPGDLLAMTLEELRTEEERLAVPSLWMKLIRARDEAQAQVEAYTRRKQDVTRAMIAKLESKRK